MGTINSLVESRSTRKWMGWLDLRFHVKYFIPFLLLVTSCSSSDSKTEKLKKVTVYYKEGQLKSIYYLDQDSKLHNSFDRWFKNGTRSVHWKYVHGLRDGVQQAWWENGQLRAKEEYKRGKKHGEYTLWSPNGKKDLHEVYRNDSLIFKEEIFDSVGMASTFESLLNSCDSSQALEIIKVLYPPVDTSKHFR